MRRLQLSLHCNRDHPDPHSFPTRRSSDLAGRDEAGWMRPGTIYLGSLMPLRNLEAVRALAARKRSEEHTSELQSLRHLVCRLLLEKKKRAIPLSPQTGV